MHTPAFRPRQFLRSVYGTEPFIDYCRSRGIPFEQLPGWLMHDEDEARWRAALAVLPASEQTRIELELSQVNELATRTALALLVEALQGESLPPDSVPDGAALALWFFLHRPTLFHDVFLGQGLTEAASWRRASVPPGIALDHFLGRRAALADTLKEFFAVREGTGRFCAVEAYALPASFCFTAYLADRLQLLDVFTEKGEHRVQAARPAFRVLFVYSPSEGSLLLQSRQRSPDRVLDLFRRFAQAVLGIDLSAQALAPSFRLDLLKRRFDPPLDADDMERARVKALALAYPGRLGRRRIKLETHAGDGQFAILDLLRSHGGGDVALEHLAVAYAELQVTLRTRGRAKGHVIRLWPDRCSLDQSPLGERFYRCLRRWGLLYGP